MKLEIPDNDKELLRHWLLGSNEQTDKVLAALEDEQPALEWAVLTQRIASKLQVEERGIRNFITGLFSISNAVAMFDAADKAHAAEILFNSIVDESTSVADRELFETRVSRVLKTKSIEITGKALSVMLDNPSTFQSARVVSEFRPVFTDDGLEPQAAVIVHQLKISYATGAERPLNEAFFALDRSDLERLKAVVERALEKHVKLAQQAERLNLPVLEESHGG